QEGSSKKSIDAIVAKVDPGRFAISTDIPSLSFLKAGRFDSDYFSAVSAFQRAGLHERAPLAMESLLTFWSRSYRFVLIDSTSGVNELSGLCAMMLPDKLVAAFTPSRQSLLGALDTVRCAVEFRKHSGSSRPLSIFPLPCKIEVAEPELRARWRFGAGNGSKEGYQAAFEALFRELEPGTECALDAYF